MTSRSSALAGAVVLATFLTACDRDRAAIPNDDNDAVGGDRGSGVRGSLATKGPGRATPESATILGNTGGSGEPKAAAKGGAPP
jgi:hypothetical protein